ncbi:hypothetical protein BJ508DRAFT_347085 [Ascobolus immersus RN42]|uniref:Uncharacterized protein n=1 Tax=Ascobolus immersus RN42 TaxID=1160509 RepID=A0A3N4I4Z9_ASCIM|nr:hypothetical protein BJ508DRAFT_347085 [Ascobolus immersus RN42]
MSSSHANTPFDATYSTLHKALEDYDTFFFSTEPLMRLMEEPITQSILKSYKAYRKVVTDIIPDVAASFPAVFNFIENPHRPESRTPKQIDLVAKEALLFLAHVEANYFIPQARNTRIWTEMSTDELHDHVFALSEPLAQKGEAEEKLMQEELWAALMIYLGKGYQERPTMLSFQAMMIVRDGDLASLREEIRGFLVARMAYLIARGDKVKPEMLEKFRAGWGQLLG